MTIEELEKQLAEATEYVKQVLARRWTMKELGAAFEREAEAQRVLAAVKGDEYARPFDIGFVPEAAVSEPAFFQTERSSILTFSAMQEQPDGTREDAGYGLVEIVHCRVSAFGEPNDESLKRHPLYSKGLRAYGVYEIANSAWIKAEIAHERSSLPDVPDTKQSHFIFTFHDSTFQCIASELRAMLIPRPFENVMVEVKKKAEL